MSSERVAVVMAGGKGTRMNSELPKVLVPANGRPLIEYVLDALEQAGIQRIIVVVGYRAELVIESLSHRKNLEFAEQKEQLGTGHAVMMCRSNLKDHQGPVLVVTGDSPMIQVSSIRSLFDEFQKEEPGCILGTLLKDDPTGLGRIVRDSDDNFIKIVEEKDATDEEKQVGEVNMSTYVFDCQAMLESLDRLTNDNRQREYYVTDCPGILLSMDRKVIAAPVLKPCEALSVNNQDDLKAVEQALSQSS